MIVIWFGYALPGMMTLTSMVLTFLAVNFYKMIFTKEAHERKMKRQMEQTLEATREAQEGSIQVGVWSGPMTIIIHHH